MVTHALVDAGVPAGLPLSVSVGVGDLTVYELAGRVRASRMLNISVDM